VRPWVPRYDFAASLLRPWRLCCVLGRSKDAVRSRGMCEGSLRESPQEAQPAQENNSLGFIEAVHQ